MIEKLDQSSEDVLGFKASGDISKADYETMIPAVEAALQTYETVHMLLDLTEFKGEKAEAWGADLKFGRDYHKKISKMAIVGDKKWEEWLTKVAGPFYAVEAKFYHSAEIDSAWAWLRT
ncbi:MAG: STAS/SEC14 domain-containing protein [Anaerolineae bacterium]|nr:STAS/SEC14 domain-containing protein [Anaerolineae bacterium]